MQLCDPVGGVVNDRVATLNQLYCDEDVDAAAHWGNGLVNAFGLANAHLLFTREAYPTRAYGLLANLAAGASARKKVTEDPGVGARLPEGSCIGDPQRIIDIIKRWESIGIDEINFFLNALEVIPQDKVLDSMRLFAAEVMPHFSDQAHPIPGAASAAAGA